VKNLSPFYIQKVLDQIAGPVKKTSRLWDWSLLVKTRTDDRSKRLLDSYPVLVEKHKTLNSTRGVMFCSKVDGYSDEEIQVRLADEYVSNVYIREKRENLCQHTLYS
jgi:hypothetical protein